MGEPVRMAYTAFDGTEISKSCLQLSIIKKKIGGANDIARLAAPKTAQVLYNTFRVGPRLILRSAFELLRANMVTRVISVVVLLAIDKFNLIRGRISVKQFIINVTLALMLLVGGTAGWILGSSALSLLVENLVLGIVAGIIGAGILSAGLGFFVNKVIHLFVKDDTEDMLDIYSQAFAVLAQEHRLSIEAIEMAKKNIGMSRQMVRDIFVQKDKDSYANSIIEPHIMQVLHARKKENDNGTA